MLNQIAHGLHLRQYSRAFVFSDAADKTRHVFVSIDACMGTQIVKLEVLLKLETLFPGLYTESKRYDQCNTYSFGTSRILPVPSLRTHLAWLRE